MEKKLLPKSKAADARVFLSKMKGDYYRYLAEIKPPEMQMEPMKSAEESYDEAHAICLASSELRPSHPIRLSLALNFSVFKHEILRQPHAALDMAKDVNTLWHLSLGSYCIAESVSGLRIRFERFTKIGERFSLQR